MNSQGIVLFHTTSAAIRAEKHLSRAGMQTKLVHTPRELSSDCGFALRLMNIAAPDIEQLLNDAGIEFAAVHFPYPR